MYVLIADGLYKTPKGKPYLEISSEFGEVIRIHDQNDLRKLNKVVSDVLKKAEIYDNNNRN